jgi:hypothetical protein
MERPCHAVRFMVTSCIARYTWANPEMLEASKSGTRAPAVCQPGRAASNPSGLRLFVCIDFTLPKCETRPEWQIRGGGNGKRTRARAGEAITAGTAPEAIVAAFLRPGLAHATSGRVCSSQTRQAQRHAAKPSVLTKHYATGHQVVKQQHKNLYGSVPRGTITGRATANTRKGQNRKLSLGA